MANNIDASRSVLTQTLYRDFAYTDTIKTLPTPLKRRGGFREELALSYFLLYRLTSLIK